MRGVPYLCGADYVRTCVPIESRGGNTRAYDDFRLFEVANVAAAIMLPLHL
jgi:hypothetical protein